ncbi:MAG: shikimate dehydrogenase [Acidobacteria bacterium]|nr:MAG: shikimate dehydrogenase [Acidobacteriota bacterium]PYY22070.1 MAG: shikimate dehydrogenase [Acidobacteriota bacterium]
MPVRRKLMKSDTPGYAARFLRHRLPRLCVALFASSPSELMEKIEHAANENSLLELRLDYLSKPALLLPKLKEFGGFHRDILLIATCRRAANGGKFRGTVASQLEILLKAAAAGCQLVDIEMESAKALKANDIEKLRQQAGLMISFHDFRGTKKLEETWEQMHEFPADYIKIVSTAKSLSDNVKMMRLLEQRSDLVSTVGVCMGERGIISRILNVRFGSAFTFASAEAGAETAPGQMTARVLRDVFRIDAVDAATRVYGVAGVPIGHSLSPEMMNTAFRRENINAVYVPLQTSDVDDLLKCARDMPIQGLSVTMPLKQEIIERLDKTDALSTKIGACNTVIRSQDGKLYGFNTDVAGVVRPLEQRISLTRAKILVIGAGGAARAAVFGLKERNAEVWVMNRTAETGQKLARQAHAHYISHTHLKKLEFDVIINATPVGMEGRPQSPLEESDLRTRYLFEMIYNPAETRLVKMARAKGIQVIPGTEMFVHQGARQFEIWTGKPAPVEDMHRAVLYALGIVPPAFSMRESPQLAQAKRG